MRAHGVEAVDCFGVDNVLVRPGDPLFAGYCWAKQAQCGTLSHASHVRLPTVLLMRLLSGARVVAKACPEEKVGVFAVDDAGRAAVVEYSEMDPKEAASVDPDTGALS